MHIENITMSPFAGDTDAEKKLKLKMEMGDGKETERVWLVSRVASYKCRIF